MLLNEVLEEGVEPKFLVGRAEHILVDTQVVGNIAFLVDDVERLAQRFSWGQGQGPRRRSWGAFTRSASRTRFMV
jgi:hypothetical protein